MSSLRASFCDLCIILVIGLLGVCAHGVPSSTPITSTNEASGNCSCGGFATTTPSSEEAPLLSQAPGLVVRCNEEGGMNCKNLCNVLATVTKAKGPEILCNKLKTANELKLSAFYKVCDMPWVYADMTAEEPLCCEGGAVKQCLTVDSPPLEIDAKTIM